MPEITKPLLDADAAERHSPDAWAQRQSTNPHLLAGAKVHNHWVQGDLLTLAQFEAGVKAFAELEVK